MEICSRSCDGTQCVAVMRLMLGWRVVLLVVRTLALLQNHKVRCWNALTYALIRGQISMAHAEPSTILPRFLLYDMVRFRS